MGNAILKTIDTSISKVAISVTDDKYQSSINLWKDRVDDTTYDELSKMPTSLEEAIHKFIPRIKEITYEDLRNDSIHKCYKCIIEFEIEPMKYILLPNKPYTTRWYVEFTDHVYKGVKLKDLSENELKMYSLSFALEMANLCPTYYTGIITGTSREGDLGFTDTYYTILKLCYPSFYKSSIKVKNEFSLDNKIKKQTNNRELDATLKRNDIDLKVLERELKSYLSAIFIWTLISSLVSILFIFSGLDYFFFNLIPDKSPLLMFISGTLWIHSNYVTNSLKIRALITRTQITTLRKDVMKILQKELSDNNTKLKDILEK